VQTVKILITGANGFIGSALCEELTSELDKYELFCITRCKNNMRLSFSENINIIEYDLLNKNIHDLPNNIDVVVHLAGNSKTFLSSDEAREQLLDNLAITSNIMTIAEKVKAKKIIFASSVYVYSGIRAKRFDEEMPLAPNEALGISKLASELMLKAFTLNYDVDICALRLFTVYGLGSKKTQFLPEAIRKITNLNDDALFGNREVKRDFIHISDVIRAVKLAFTSVDLEGYNAINIASGQSYRIEEVVNLVKTLTGSKKEIKFKKSIENNRLIDLDHCGDISLAKRLLKWHPKIEFKDGLRYLIESII